MQKLGRFEIVSEIGRGGCGVVYRATDPKIGRPVAIKTLLPDHSAPNTAPRDPADSSATRIASSLYQRLLVEAQSAGRLSHPNIVTIHELDEFDGITFIVMELVEGHTLSGRIADGPIGSATALDILRQIAAALDHAHHSGVVHRDIKPANILISPTGQVKVTDFGIAKVLQSEIQLTRTGATMGTAYYMAPEQVEAKPVSPQTDQFALGVLAYELLAGSRPFSGEHWAAVLNQILNVEPRAISGFHPRVTEVVRRALAKQPSSRYASCGDFIQDLNQALLGPSSMEATLPLPRPPSARPPSARRPWLVPVVVGAVIAVVAALVPFLMTKSSPLAQQQHPPERPPELVAENKTPVLTDATRPTTPVTTPSPAKSGAPGPVAYAPVPTAPPIVEPTTPPPQPQPTQTAPTALPPPPKPQPETPAPKPIAVAPVAPTPNPDEKAWADVATSRNIAALEQYRRDHPNSPHAREALDRIAQLEWERVKSSNDSKAVSDYLARFPSGPASDEARQQLRTLEAAARERQSRQLIDAALERFSQAIQHRSIDELKRVWPSLPAREQASFRDFFQTAREVKMILEPRGAPEISGDTALVRATRTMEVIGPRGREKGQVNQVVIRLKRSGAEMVIDSVSLAQ